jgi:DNA-binding CsgD family transcriptional regulator
MSTPVAPVPHVVAGSPQAFDIYRRFAANPRATARVLILGNGGAGKSALLGAFRNILRATNIQSSELIGSFDPTKHTALLVDDAHLLSADELQQLAALAHRDEHLLVVATQRRYDDVNLVELLKLFESVGTVVELTPLNEQGVASAAHARFGTPLNHKLAGIIFGLTDGLSYLVDAGLRAADPRVAGTTGEGLDRVAAEVRGAVADRLQRLEWGAVIAMALESLGAELHETELADILGVEPQRARSAIMQATACGLMHRTGKLASIVTGELFNVLGHHQSETLSRRLFEIRVSGGHLDPRLAVNLAESGVRDARLCELLLSQAELRASSDRVSADRMYNAAITSGATYPDLTIRRAGVAFQLERFDEALALIDSCWEGAAGSELKTAARVAASAWCTRGMLNRGADVYSWIGPERVGEDGPVAALLLLCAGQPQAAADMMSGGGAKPPTSEVSGNELLAHAMLATLNQPSSATTSLFVRALAVLGVPAASSVRPDSAVAITAIAAMHAGDLSRARKVLQRRLESKPSSGTRHARHRLLLAWTAMLEGNLQSAATELASITETGDLALRDRFLADSLRVGLARRRADIGQLHAALARARESFDEYSVDLLSLLPVGELWSAASKIGKAHEVRHLVDEAFALLGRLGDPPFWAAALHWSGVSVAIQSDSPCDLTAHAHALREAASQCEYAATLALAGRTWVRILGGRLDVAEIARAASGLQSIGLGWDGANLAGRAALRCADSRPSAELLQIARAVGQPVSVAGQESGHMPSDADVLSDRQREIAALLVAGLTYKVVAERLFISPKTVEYHVAEIKRRIGTESRSELLSRLHALDLSSAC